MLLSFLFGVPPHDRLTFVAVSAVCLAASFIPARLDPMVALGHE